MGDPNEEEEGEAEDGLEPLEGEPTKPSAVPFSEPSEPGPAEQRGPAGGGTPTPRTS